MNPWERRCLLGIVLLVVGIGLTQFMTFNRFTDVGMTLAWITVLGGLAGHIVGPIARRSSLQWLGTAFMILFALFAAALAFSPPRAKEGLLIDTTEAHRRYHRVEAVGAPEMRARGESREEDSRP